MGTNLTPIIPRKKIGLKGLMNKVVAIDALNSIYQFLALIRLPNGEPLKDSKGRITSHLVGIVSRYTKLLVEYYMKPIFIFDGPPHPLKGEEIKKRKAQRAKARREWLLALSRGDYEKAFSKAVVSIEVNEQIISDAKKLIKLMGFPIIEALHDAEAQASYIVSRGEAWCVGTLDWDALLYGAPRMVRYITVTGTEWLPSKKMARPLIPELIELTKILRILRITREQLVDIAILVGTDYNRGIKGIGPKKALHLIKLYGSLERLPLNIKEKLPEHYNKIREIFLYPLIRKDYRIEFEKPKVDELFKFLVEERDFSPRRVEKIIERLESFSYHGEQLGLDRWF